MNHHRLRSVLYDRDLLGTDRDLSILRERQIEFDYLFNTHIVSDSSHRVKAHMLLCEYEFYDQLK